MRLSVIGTFLDTVQRHGLLAPGDRVLVAVSGGADSVCLLDLLSLVQERFGLTLIGFHLNHGLRAEAARDERFVQALFQRMKLELVVVRARVRLYARRHRLGIEEAGRTLRYQHMLRIARRRNCSRIALGHTAGDNLETMLLNLCRGTGLPGLAGIPACRDLFIRPLIDLQRAALLRHLQARGLSWVEDTTNQVLDFRRNLIRHRVVTLLERINPGVVANARRTARLLADENDYLDELAAAAAASCARRTSGTVQIDTVRFRDYNTALKRRVVRWLLPGLDSADVEQVLNLCHGRSGRRLVLGQGLVGRLHSGIAVMHFTKESPRNG
jgi:tRNA(Ile)-lysidine synthase